MAEFKNHIDKTLVNEGGYVNDPDDRGGETKYGISKKQYPDLDIKSLTIDEAKEIYKRDYWDKVSADDIEDEHIAFELFDTAVNMGVRTATKLIQLSCEAHPDGIMGANTLNKINSSNKELILTKFKLAKVARYAYLCKKRPENKKYLFGWINRTLGA